MSPPASASSIVSSITATTTGRPGKPMARKVAISRARDATAANIVLSAPNIAPTAMIAPTTMPMMRSTFVTLALRMIPAPMREKVGACS